MFTHSLLCGEEAHSVHVHMLYFYRVYTYIYVLSVFVIFFRLIVLHKLMPSEGVTRLTARIISRLTPVDVMSNGLCKILLYKCCHVPLVHGGV